MNTAYLERTAQDLCMRASTIVLNGEQTVSIQSIQRTGNQVVIVTQGILGLNKITSLRLLDENGNMITEREANFAVVESQQAEFTFRFVIKGGKGNGV
ncbi:hypothetical protein [Aneurinibacillus aneurinilyticus]|uniref:Uncharacterized protein n=1 Tax=Aneurinibacillus aneurinilyticus TaxID=1391 RepID=A0A848D4J2_ANEAE|nr:hypothetical protein [Aneurinibacillus aneurinilyticus]NMF00978.1 hypothetical protein [Aneurinibacillus aneurinilyticus]